MKTNNAHQQRMDKLWYIQTNGILFSNKEDCEHNNKLILSNSSVWISRTDNTNLRWQKSEKQVIWEGVNWKGAWEFSEQWKNILCWVAVIKSHIVSLKSVPVIECKIYLIKIC